MSLMSSGWKYLVDFGSLPEPLKRNGRYTASDTVCAAGRNSVCGRLISDGNQTSSALYG